MHPSDSRMSDWSTDIYNVDSSELADFPMAIFDAVNSPVKIEFTATSSQTGAATLRIGTTLSFAGGRPQATVRFPPFNARKMSRLMRQINDYTGDAPSAPTNLNSRGVTRGAYRGYGEVYDVSIPEGTIVEGTNTVRTYFRRNTCNAANACNKITINVISGSSGDEFLSPNFVSHLIMVDYEAD